VKWNGGDRRRGERAGKDMVRRDCNRRGMRQSEVTVFIFKIFGLVHPYTIVKFLRPIPNRCSLGGEIWRGAGKFHAISVMCGF